MGFQMLDCNTLHIQSFGSKHASRECERALFFVVVQAAEVINKTLSNNQKLKIIIDACGVDPFLFFLEGFDNGEIYDDPTKAIKFKGDYVDELRDYVNPRLSIYAKRFIWYSKGIEVDENVFEPTMNYLIRSSRHIKSGLAKEDPLKSTTTSIIQAMNGFTLLNAWTP